MTKPKTKSQTIEQLYCNNAHTHKHTVTNNNSGRSSFERGCLNNFHTNELRNDCQSVCRPSEHLY